MITDQAFIRKVKSHKILYSKEPKDKDSRAKIWHQIAIESNMDNSELAENRWNDLVDDYKKKYLRIGIEDRHSFPNAVEMSFLQPHIICIDSTVNTNVLTQIEIEQLKQILNDELHEAGEEKEILPVKVEATEKDKPNSQSTTLSLAGSTSNINKLDKYNSDLTALELIFLGYAKTLEKMPPFLRLKAKRKIADIMVETELQMLELGNKES